MSEDTMALDSSFMFRTAYPEVYEEICHKRKLFKLDIHLFAAALAIGILNNATSTKKPIRDIIRLAQLSRDEHQEIKEVINILSQFAYTKPDKRARGEAIIGYSDGGLDLLWKDIQTQGVLDLPRIIDDVKKKWPSRFPELLALLEQNE
jgi:hypothetical protein